MSTTVGITRARKETTFMVAARLLCCLCLLYDGVVGSPSWVTTNISSGTRESIISLRRSLRLQHRSLNSNGSDNFIGYLQQQGADRHMRKVRRNLLSDDEEETEKTTTGNSEETASNNDDSKIYDNDKSTNSNISATGNAEQEVEVEENVKEQGETKKGELSATEGKGEKQQEEKVTTSETKEVEKEEDAASSSAKEDTKPKSEASNEGKEERNENKGDTSENNDEIEKQSASKEGTITNEGGSSSTIKDENTHTEEQKEDVDDNEEIKEKETITNKPVTVPPTQSPVRSPTDKPTEKTYVPNDEDPIKEEDEMDAEEEEVQELETELKQEEKVARQAGGLGIFLGIVAMILTAHQMSENPDGIVASICRLAITISSVVVKIVCMPCRKLIGSNGNSHHNGHMPISTNDYSYRNDPYRSNANAAFELT
mmetsp:Transcript_45725/g.51163  ORF Transcript_45725/g.51163 Transcript_45725/m.51163 type:complete len:428 (+) Transcript_45725:145-1428(+)